MSSEERRTYEAILDRIEGVPPRGATRLVAIDGRGGSGKSTLAARLMSIDPSLKHLPTDHFPSHSDEHPFHPTGTQLRISEARLAMALLPLTVNEPGAYHRSWWGSDEVGPLHRVDPGGTVLVEGAYALLPSLRGFYDFSIWVECPPEQALAQAMARDEVGARGRAQWTAGHAPNVERYIEATRPSESADMVVFLTPDRHYGIVQV